jgi:RNA polymerase sigma factor (sigma-70 family)
MSQDDGHEWFDLDLAVMEDEAVVVLAKECEYGPARDELIVRYGPQTSRLIGWLAHCHGFSHSDGEDARQNAVFWVVEAINKYDTRQIGKPQGCSFRSFIHRVLVARFKDFAKHLRRVDRHYDRTARTEAHEPMPADADIAQDDPALVAEAQESMHRLQSTLRGLDGESLRLWGLLSEGHNLREIASQLGMSYDSAKRRRRKLIEQLKLRLSASCTSIDLAGKTASE